MLLAEAKTRRTNMSVSTLCICVYFPLGDEVALTVKNRTQTHIKAFRKT